MKTERKPKKEPLIRILSTRYCEYTEKELYSMIMCGEVKVNTETIREPGRMVIPGATIEIQSRKWVSRGGEKLEHAVLEWGIDVKDKTVIDAGASTGGFTDCLLYYGVAKVHSIDVGYNQLDYRLRTDGRVNVLERTNIMSLSELTPRPDFAVADLSFRSIKGAASHILKLTKDNLLIALIKPQFELSETEGFDGIIRDRLLLVAVLRQTAAGLAEDGVKLEAVLESPIKGGKGNTEFLFKLHLSDQNEESGNSRVIESFLGRNLC